MFVCVSVSDRQTEKERETERELLTYSYCKSQLELNLYRRAKSPTFFHCVNSFATVSVDVCTTLSLCVYMCALVSVMGGLALVASL